MYSTQNIISPSKFLNKLFGGLTESRISRYTTVSTAFKPEEATLINENLDEIAKYAESNKCNLSFRPSYKHKDSFKMEVEKRVEKTQDFCDGSDVIKMEVLEKRGAALLPKSIQTADELLGAIRTEASKLLYEQK